MTRFPIGKGARMIRPVLAQSYPLIVPRSYCYRHRNGFQWSAVSSSAAPSLAAIGLETVHLLRGRYSQHVADLVEGCGQAVLICEIVELWGGGRISARAPTLLVRAAEVIE